MDNVHRTRLLEAILTEPEDYWLYKYNAYFKVGLDHYVDMIPIFVDGLKQHAIIEDTRMKAAIAAAESEGMAHTAGDIQQYERR